MPRFLHESTHHPNTIRNVGPSTSKVLQTPNQTSKFAPINSVSSLKFREFCTELHRDRYWIAVLHLVHLQDILRVRLLRYKNSRLTLFNFEAKEVSHQTQICHFEFSRHRFFEFLH